MEGSKSYMICSPLCLRMGTLAKLYLLFLELLSALGSWTEALIAKGVQIGVEWGFCSRSFSRRLHQWRHTERMAGAENLALICSDMQERSAAVIWNAGVSEIEIRNQIIRGSNCRLIT